MPPAWQFFTAQRALAGAVITATAALALILAPPRTDLGRSISSILALPASAQSCQSAAVQPGADRQAQIAKFNQGKYTESAALGWQIVQRDANDATALYYLSQAFVKLNRLDEARTYFTRCYHATKDATMKLYCQQAVANLAKVSSTATASGAASSGTTTKSATGEATEGSESGAQSDSVAANAAGEVQKTSDPALMARKMQILKTGADEIAYRKKIFEDAVLAAKKHQAEQMEGIPQFFERRYRLGYTGGTIASTYENPEYKEALERSERELKQKLTQLDEEFKRREADITADCKRRASAYDDVDRGLASQKQGRNSQIQLHSQHTNSFVRHFVNFDGSTPVGLKTRQVAQPLQPASQPKPATVHK